ncbi:endonuclease domain-containing protein [Micromonospora sp. URMC 105]|uniref:endonuclease domain-containing protein n=1 Tax=Micromonospora sp. URMC 105 TaxID=3423413 RepID=UPI003F1DA893
MVGSRTCKRCRKVRGPLCASCNAVLGHFKDSPATLTAALRYLGNPSIPTST